MEPFGRYFSAMPHGPYPSDATDDEWAFAAPYLSLCRADAGQRCHDLRAVFDALRWMVRSGAPWRMLPKDFPPWAAVYQQTQRWLDAEVFEEMAHDLRCLLRMAGEREPEPSAAIVDARTLRSTPESGARAGYDGAKRKKGSKLHAAVDTLGHLLALHVTPADVDDRAEVGKLTAALQEAAGDSVEVAFVDQGYTGERAAAAAEANGIALEVVKLPEAKRGFVLLPRRWVVERSFAWATRFRRLVKDYERLPQTLAGLHVVAFALVMLQNAAPLIENA
jgi:transposase